VTVPNGYKVLVAWNGSDFVKVASSVIDLASEVTGVLPIANGGTGTSSTTFVNLTTNVTSTLPVANGGTGASSFTINNVLLGNAASSFQTVAPGTTGNVLTSNGTTWSSQANPGSSGVTTGKSIALAMIFGF
jgi:hypothetical protein